MRKLKLHSPDLAQENLAKLRALFPCCVTEAADETGTVRLAADFDQLRQALGGRIVEGPQERYRLDWPGKREALVAANAPIAKTLRPVREQSVDFAATRNLFIEGDNLDALKLLQASYRASVKLIYIDPPYNTGRNLLYKNDFRERMTDFLARSRQIDRASRKPVAVSETAGRFHSDWLSMMYQRLTLAKPLLAKDGVLVCSIDENEFGPLSVLMQEIFAEPAWEHAYITVVHNPRGQQGTNFSYVHEYLIFVYPSGTKAIADRKIKDAEVRWSQFRNWGGESRRNDAKNCFYPVLVKDDAIIGFGAVCADTQHPQQTEWSDGVAAVYPIDVGGIERKWRYARQSVEAIRGMLRARRSGLGYQIEIGKTFGRYRTVWTDSRYDANEYGTKLVGSLVEGSGFTFPKSLWAVYDPVAAVTGADKDALVLDFFAGSATTAHGVMQLNADDGGNRRFIMVQLAEPIDPAQPAHQRGYTTIAEIAKERIRRTGERLLTGACHPGWKRDVGFRVLTVAGSSAHAIAPPPSARAPRGARATIKPDRADEAWLFQALLDCGVDPSLPVSRETIAGTEALVVGANALIGCFDGAITDALARALAIREPLHVVFRDSLFLSDAARISLGRIFRALSPRTMVSAI